jgi:hypothetical protein
MTMNTATSPPDASVPQFRLTDEDIALLRAAIPAKLKERESDVLVWYCELPRLLEEGHEGRCALVQGGKIASLWDTHNDAVQAGYNQFGVDVPFMTSDITSRELDRLKAFLAQERAKACRS